MCHFLCVQCAHLLVLLRGQTIFVSFLLYLQYPQTLRTIYYRHCIHTHTPRERVSVCHFRHFIGFRNSKCIHFCQYRLNACRFSIHIVHWGGTNWFGDYVKRDFNYRAHFNSSFVFIAKKLYMHFFHYFSPFNCPSNAAAADAPGCISIYSVCLVFFCIIVVFFVCVREKKIISIKTRIVWESCRWLFVLISFLLTQSIPLIKWQLITCENSSLRFLFAMNVKYGEQIMLKRLSILFPFCMLFLRKSRAHTFFSLCLIFSSELREKKNLNSCSLLQAITIVEKDFGIECHEARFIASIWFFFFDFRKIYML